MALKLRAAALLALGASFAATPSLAEGVVKIGLMGPFSGNSARYGEAWKQAVDVFMKEHGDVVAGNKVEVLMRDLGGVDPLKAKALAQELVVKDGVQYLAGIVYSPNALALGAFANQAKVPIVIFNAATSAILDKSKYFLRVSFTEPQIYVPAALYASSEGRKNVVTMVTDYAPGIDAENFFSKAFEKNGGKIAGKIRMPLATTDFAPYLNRAKSMGVGAIVGFLPGGTPTFGFLTAYNNSGLRAAGVSYLGSDETLEDYLQKYGDVVVGVQTVFPYSAAHRSKENDAFKKLMHASYPNDPVVVDQVEAYDGMRLLYHMIEATGGKKDGDKAIASALGLSWESPRGPVRIDAKTRDIVENIYVRTVKKGADGKLYNDEIAVYPMQPDYGRAGHPIPTVEAMKPTKLP